MISNQNLVLSILIFYGLCILINKNHDKLSKINLITFHSTNCSK